MEKTSLPLELDCEGIHYTGWATPSDHLHDNGEPASYHIVLNQVFFGNLSRDKGKWIVDEQRPAVLTAAVGECMDKTIAREGQVPAL